MKTLPIPQLSPSAIIAPVPRLQLVKGCGKSDSDDEAFQPEGISDLVGLSHPKEIEPTSSETTKSEKSPAHLKAIEDVNLFRAGLITATELRARYPKEYKIWDDMKQRCRGNPEKGIPPINLDHALEAFADFLEVTGPRLHPTWSLDRRDPTGPYSPDNVRWASKQTQSRNRTNAIYLTYNDETLLLVVWAERLGVNPNTLRQRKRNGWTDEETITGYRTLPTPSALQRPQSSRDPFEYTPWHPRIREEFERRYQRYRQSGEHRLAFAKRYTEEWMAAITEEAEQCWWPDYHTPSEAEVAKLEELSRDYRIWESNHRYNSLQWSEKLGDRLFGNPELPDWVETRLRAYA